MTLPISKVYERRNNKGNEKNVNKELEEGQDCVTNSSSQQSMIRERIYL